MKAPILVVFDTHYGTCAKIAEHVEQRLRARGLNYDVEQTPGGRPISIDEYSAVIIIGAIYNRHHTESIETFVRQHAHSLAGRPTSFVSVSLGAAARLRLARTGVRRIAERLFASSGWHPSRVTFVGGSLDYPLYAPAVRNWMRTAAFVFGLPTDVSKRHELTRWADVDEAVDDTLDEIDESDALDLMTALA